MRLLGLPGKDLEDERLSVQASDLSELMDAWYTRHPRVVTQEHGLSPDQVQNLPGWERFGRRLLDQGTVHLNRRANSPPASR